MFLTCFSGSVQAQPWNQDPSSEYESLWKEGHYREALEQLNRQMDERPELARIWSYRYVRWVLDRAALQAEIGEIDRAIEDLEWVNNHYAEPVVKYRLARLYRQRGRQEDYEHLLQGFSRDTERYWRYFSQEENLLAIAQLAELSGENPKQLLSSIYSALMRDYPGFTDGYAGAGEMALRKRAYDLAEKYFEEALKIDPMHLASLAGLAETYWRSNNPKAQETLDRLMEVNPNAIRGRALQAELLLDRGEADEALEEITQGLEINPNDLELKALEATAYFLQDAPEKMEEAQQEALEFNPQASIVYRLPGQIASRHYRFKEAAALQRQALAVDPEDADAKALLGMDLLRLGEEEEGRRVLEEAFAADPYHVHAYNLLSLMDSLKDFERLKDPAFELQVPKQETDILAQEALELLQEAITLYQTKYDIQLDLPVHVQIFDDHDDFMVRSLGLPGHIGFLGICFGKLVTMDSPSARPKGEMNWKSVLWHEFVHVITLQKTNNRMPRWLSEGISVYEETQRSPAWGQKLDTDYQAIIDLDDLPGVRELEICFTQPKTSLHLMLGYFLAGEFVQCYTDAYGFDALRDALARIGAGEETYAALTAAAGAPDLEAVSATFRTYLEKRLAPLANLPEVEVQPEEGPSLMDRIFGRTPDARPWLEKESPFTDALREGRQALAEQRWEAAEAALRRAHELYPEYEGEHEPLQLLLTVYEQTGQTDRQVETLWQIVRHQATALNSCRQLIHRLEACGDWGGALEAVERAMEIDPFDPALWKQRLQAQLKDGKTSDALHTARQLVKLDAAHASEHRLRVIDLLTQLEQWPEARRETVLLLEAYPHFRQAQHRLLKIVDHEPKGNES